MKTVHILNPAAGQGKAIEFEKLDNAYITKAPGDASDFIQKTLKGANEDIHFKVYGGDGTVNEAVTGIMRSQSDRGFLSVVPVGTGNDLIKSIENADKADVLTVGDRFAINAVNTGFDLEVVLKAQEYKKKPFISGPLAYILGVVSVFTKKFGKYIHIRYQDKEGNDKVFDGEYMLAVAANGCYYGGGFKASPAADVTDGYIDLMIIKKVSKLRFLSLIKGYKEGTHIDRKTGTVTDKFKKYVIFSKCKKVIFEQIERLCIDGEVFECDKAEIGIIPKALNIYSKEKAIV